MRFLFYIPDSPVARGGISVIMEMIEVLNSNGFEALALYSRPDFEYNCHVIKAPRVWSASVRREEDGNGPRQVVRKVRNYAMSRKVAGNAEPCPEWCVQPGDVVVVPEFAADWLPDKLDEKLPLILCVQGTLPLMQVFSRNGIKAGRFSGSVAISEACAAACRMILRTEPSMIPLYIARDLYAFEPDKAFQISYMPRKRANDARTLIKAVRATPGFENINFVPIDGVGTDEAARLLRKSLFFMSLSRMEGFGLPPAEAMATGSLVIGYSGVGGDEFFNETTGFRVPEENLMAFYETLISVINRYREDPGALDAFRLKASETILGQYPKDRFEKKTISVFSEFQESLSVRG